QQGDAVTAVHRELGQLYAVTADRLAPVFQRQHLVLALAIALDDVGAPYLAAVEAELEGGGEVIIGDIDNSGIPDAQENQGRVGYLLILAKDLPGADPARLLRVEIDRGIEIITPRDPLALQKGGDRPGDEDGDERRQDRLHEPGVKYQASGAARKIGSREPHPTPLTRIEGIRIPARLPVGGQAVSRLLTPAALRLRSDERLAYSKWSPGNGRAPSGNTGQPWSWGEEAAASCFRRPFTCRGGTTTGRTAPSITHSHTLPTHNASH